MSLALNVIEADHQVTRGGKGDEPAVVVQPEHARVLNLGHGADDRGDHAVQRVLHRGLPLQLLGDLGEVLGYLE